MDCNAATQRWMQVLERHAYRVTPALQLVIQVLVSAEGPLSADRAWETVRALRPATGRATVFRAIDKLAELGLIRRVHGIESCHAYIAAEAASGPLLICQQCGTRQYLSVETLQPLIQQMEGQTGFQIRESWLQVAGLCPSCQPNQTCKTL